MPEYITDDIEIFYDNSDEERNSVEENQAMEVEYPM